MLEQIFVTEIPGADLTIGEALICGAQNATDLLAAIGISHANGLLRFDYDNPALGTLLLFSLMREPGAVSDPARGVSIPLNVEFTE